MKTAVIFSLLHAKQKRLADECSIGYFIIERKSGILDTKQTLSELSIEEKASLCSGLDFWRLKGLERFGLPSIMVTDGPHGLRKQDGQSDHLGMNASVKATCFPTASALAASFDRELVYSVGEALGKECQAEGVSVLLGPGANIKRSPLCGRNFEYFSEDPHLSSEMAAAHINGVQSQGVGTSLKHYAANNQETLRMTIDSVIDERTLHEIYLASFEEAVKKARPWTVMCSYNKVNGTYLSENKHLLADVLKGEWGFEGVVVTDWGAVKDRVKGLEAGLDLEMPGGGANDGKIVQAVKDGRLDEAKLDQAALRVLKLIEKAAAGKKDGIFYDRLADHELAAKVSAECTVLLKNENNMLPLKKSAKIAFIGEFAKNPRFQGSGSSYINASYVTNAIDSTENTGNLAYAQGYSSKSSKPDEKLAREAVEAAKNADMAVIFAGLPNSYESEGFDRKHMKLPENQNEQYMIS
jgi:beta-glucosidase